MPVSIKKPATKITAVAALNTGLNSMMMPTITPKIVHTYPYSCNGINDR